MTSPSDWQQARESSFLLEGPTGKLELVCNGVEGAAQGMALICHPHPLFGGALSNKVVFTLARALRDNGYIAVRFNFRGVGNSEGLHDDGRGELDDARAVLHWMREQRPELLVILSGFSFGAAIVTRLALAEPCNLLMLVAPPVPRWGLDQVNGVPCPVCVMQTEDDELVDAQEVKQWLAALKSPEKQLVEFKQGGHFFHAMLPDLHNSVKACLRRLQGTPFLGNISGNSRAN